MGAGILLGNFAPALINAIAAAEVASVNLVVAVLIWAMVYPMKVGVDPRSLKDVAKQPRGLAGPKRTPNVDTKEGEDCVQCEAFDTCYKLSSAKFALLAAIDGPIRR
jgi:hypothetical protein